MKKLEYNISINAPAKQVWDTMLQPSTYVQWVGAAWPGSFYEGKWEQGKKIKFISENGSGTLAVIKELKLYEYLLAEHIAILGEGGIEDATSDMAKGWTGTTESYYFSGDDKTTHLNVEIMTNPAWEKMFNDGWPHALAKLKEICEK